MLEFRIKVTIDMITSINILTNINIVTIINEKTFNLVIQKPVYKYCNNRSIGVCRKVFG